MRYNEQQIEARDAAAIELAELGNCVSPCCDGSVILDGDFTPIELRHIADVMDRLVTSIEALKD